MAMTIDKATNVISVMEKSLSKISRVEILFIARFSLVAQLNFANDSFISH